MTAISATTGHGPAQRIDKYLWFVRLAKSRSIAQAMAERGIMRLNGRRIDRAHSPVRVGDLITLAQGERVRVVRVLDLPSRRGPANEAVRCYEELALGEDVTKQT
ncbi:MAG: RNA-binding S4 domain-containing protein [Sphingobium sp.]